MPEAWHEELGRKVFGEVKPGVEKGLRSESRQSPSGPCVLGRPPSPVHSSPWVPEGALPCCWRRFLVPICHCSTPPTPTPATSVWS